MKSFGEYQESLLKNGMAILATSSEAGDGGFGGIIFNKTIKNPLGDLQTTVRENVLDALSDKFQKFNLLMQGQKSDDQYLEHLLGEFEEQQQEKSSWQYIKYSNLEWLDTDNPWSGILIKSREDISSYFDLFVSPDRLKEIWENELNIVVDSNIDGRMHNEIDEILEEFEIGCDPDFSHGSDRDWKVGLGDLLHHSCPKKAKYKEIKSSYLTQLFSPVFGDCKNHTLYIATPDTTYLAIGRPDFYPIIAAERLDGSYEITIFEAYNS